MAEIPVDKKSSFPWWLLLIGALLLGALLWWMLADNDDDAVYTAADRVVVNGAIDMDDVVVTDVTGDMSFYVRDAAGDRYFVVFDEVPTPGTAKEGLLDINVGDTLDLDGTLRGRSFTLPATVRATIPVGEETFIFATDIDK